MKSLFTFCLLFVILGLFSLAQGRSFRQIQAPSDLQNPETPALEDENAAKFLFVLFPPREIHQKQ